MSVSQNIPYFNGRNDYVLSNASSSTYTDRNSNDTHGRIHSTASMVTSYWDTHFQKSRKSIKVFLIQMWKLFYF